MEIGFQCFQAQLQTLINVYHYLDKLNYWLSANKIFQKKEVFVLHDN